MVGGHARGLVAVVFVVGAALSGSAAANTGASSGAFPSSVQHQLGLVVQRPAVLGVPGAVIAVTQPGHRPYSRTVGYAQLSPDAKITSGTHFRIGSITKTFTATVVLQLVQEGKISLDDTIGKYVPDAPNADQVTIASLLNMTSGVYDEGAPTSALASQSQSDPSRCWTPQEIVALANQQGPGAPFGTFYYSDTNYVLLGMVVEQVTGTAFGEQLQHRVLDPLGLHDTTYPAPCSLASPAPSATGYGVVIESLTGPEGPRYTRSPIPPVSPSALGPAGAMISTVGDLQIWAKAVATGKLLNAATQQQRLQTGTVTTVFSPLAGVDLTTTRGLPARYGMGIVNAGGFLGHNGLVNGFTSEMWYQPSTGTTIVVLTNATVTTGGQLVSVPDFMFSSIAQIVTPKTITTTNTSS